jgi:hypothetical protein
MATRSSSRISATRRRRFERLLIYNPWFARHGINAAVVPLGVTGENFREAFSQICRFTNLHGALITMPHKAAVVGWLDEASAAVRVAGACNAVRRSEDGKLVGDLFDGEGFVRGVARIGGVFPSFYPELFPTRARVSGMAIAQNIGTMPTAFLPALFATVEPPGSSNVPLTVGAIAFGVTIISAIAAWSARETSRVHLNDLGDPAAPEVDKAEYERLRQQSVAAAT